MPPRIWTDELIARFHDLCRREVPRDLIAAEIGMTRVQVVHLDGWLRSVGRQPYELPFSTKSKPCPLAGHEAAIREMSMSGLGATLIAAHFGVSRGTVSGHMERHGLYAPHRRKGKRRRAPAVTLPRSSVSLAPVAGKPFDYDEADLRAGRALQTMLEGVV
jgi:hypothetical protein